LRDGRRGLICITDFFCTVFVQPFLLVLLLAEAFAVVALGLEQLDEVRLAVPAPACVRGSMVLNREMTSTFCHWEQQ
jgi:hypothetical protein